MSSPSIVRTLNSAISTHKASKRVGVVFISAYFLFRSITKKKNWNIRNRGQFVVVTEYVKVLIDETKCTF